MKRELVKLVLMFGAAAVVVLVLIALLEHVALTR
jgi:hypothetical protein